MTSFEDTDMAEHVNTTVLESTNQKPYICIVIKFVDLLSSFHVFSITAASFEEQEKLKKCRMPDIIISFFII